MTLSQFDARGEQVSDDETEEIIRKGDPHRGLIRYRPDGSELFVHAKINIALLQAAVSLPILLLKPVSREDELMQLITCSHPRARCETTSISKEYAKMWPARPFRRATWQSSMATAAAISTS